jgi:hypothetical protein
VGGRSDLTRTRHLARRPRRVAGSLRRARNRGPSHWPRSAGDRRCCTPAGAEPSRPSGHPHAHGAAADSPELRDALPDCVRTDRRCRQILDRLASLVNADIDVSAADTSTCRAAPTPGRTHLRGALVARRAPSRTSASTYRPACCLWKRSKRLRHGAKIQPPRRSGGSGSSPSRQALRAMN